MRILLTPAVFIIPAVLMVPLPVRGQVSGNSGFVRNDQVLTWSTLNNGQVGLAENLRLNFSSNLSSSLNMTTKDNDRWYDSIFNRAEVRYTASRDFQVAVTAVEDWNRDTYSRFGNSLLTTSLEGRVLFRPRRTMNITAGVGQVYDRRFENEDRGTTADGSFTYTGSPAQRLGTAVTVEGARSNLKRAHNELAVRGNLSYNADLATFRLELEESMQNQGYFSDVDRKKTEQRERAGRSAAVTITRGDIRTGRDLALILAANIGTKRVEDTANDDERSSKYLNNSDGTIGGVTLTLAQRLGGHLYGLVEGGYSRDENNVEREIRSRTETDVSLRSEVGTGFAADSLLAVGWIKRSRIDTPRGVPNDRDELKFEGGIRYLRFFSSNLQTGLDFRVLKTHYINIDASQSTQNKWIKTYQFSPFLVYSPVRSLRFQHVVNLYANHMDYDFDSVADPRSNITRRVSSESRIDAELSPRTRLSLRFMIENNDYGNLDKKQRKLPVEEGIRRYGEITVEYLFTEWLEVSPQYVYALRRDISVITRELVRREVDQTFGFETVLFENMTGDYHLTFSVKRIIRDTETYPTRIRDYINLTMIYGF
ncbi:hypothetical protein ACFL5H_00950 [Candidatus Latescibacterota bacterium]